VQSQRLSKPIVGTERRPECWRKGGKIEAISINEHMRINWNRSGTPIGFQSPLGVLLEWCKWARIKLVHCIMEPPRNLDLTELQVQQPTTCLGHPQLCVWGATPVSLTLLTLCKGTWPLLQFHIVHIGQISLTQ
jgi:hypothetical protein